MTFPRVTEVLRAYTNYDQVPQDILKRAAERGTSVHALCAAIAKGAWIPDNMISEGLKGYVDSFKAWSAAQVSSFVLIEKRYNDKDREFTGQLDFVILTTYENLYLVDLKTSSRAQKTYPVQMAAYDILLKKHGIEVKGAMIVYLKKDGAFPDIDCIDDLTEETSVFQSALECWHYFNKGKKNARKTSSAVPNVVRAKCDSCA